MLKHLAKRPAAIALAAVLLIPGLALAQAYPSKPVRVIVPYAPGGPVDVLTRLVADKLRVRLAQTFVIENRPGAGGNIGADAVAKAAPDGYTLLATIDAPLTVNPFVYGKLPFDALRDLAPIAFIADGGSQLLLVNAQSPFRDVAGLIDNAKKNPGKLSFASGGNGVPGHIVGELFKRAAKVFIVHIPYRGPVAATADLLAGRVDLFFGAPGPALPHVTAGKLRSLGVASGKRTPYLPNEPTVAEAGRLPGFAPPAWWMALLAPAGTPPSIIETLNQEVRRITAEADFKPALAAQLLEASAATPAQVGQRIRADHAYWDAALKNLPIKPD